jgi:hypothetical protein
MTTPADRFMRRAFHLAEMPVEAGDQDRDGDLNTLLADYRAEFGDGPNAAADWKAFLDAVEARIRHEREPDLEDPGSAAAMVMRAVHAALDEHS